MCSFNTWPSLLHFFATLPPFHLFLSQPHGGQRKHSIKWISHFFAAVLQSSGTCGEAQANEMTLAAHLSGHDKSWDKIEGLMVQVMDISATEWHCEVILATCTWNDVPGLTPVFFTSKTELKPTPLLMPCRDQRSMHCPWLQLSRIISLSHAIEIFL